MEPQKRLYVGNLPWKVRREDLSELFSQAGTVVDAYIVLDREKHRSKGYGFVEMSTLEEAQKAVDMFNEYELEGRKLMVNFARPKEEGTGGSGASDVAASAADQPAPVADDVVATEDADTDLAFEETADEEVVELEPELESEVEEETTA